MWLTVYLVYGSASRAANCTVSVCLWSLTHWFILQEGVKTENDHINLKVAGQDGSVVQFKIKRHTPLSKLMKAYCERQVSRGPSASAALHFVLLLKLCVFLCRDSQ